MTSYRDFDWTKHISQLGDLPSFNHLWEREMVEELRSWIPKDRKLKVLEIGCSNGRWLRWFQREYSAEITGVDLNQAGAKEVDNFILGDGLNLPIPDNTFDVVCSLGLIEHFPTPKLRRQLLSEHVRVAKPQTGIVWIELPNMDFSLSCLWTKIYHDWIKGYKHYMITEKELKTHFNDLGLQMLKTRYLDWFPGYFMFYILSCLHNRLSFIPKPQGTYHKPFERSFTADEMLLIGRKK